MQSHCILNALTKIKIIKHCRSNLSDDNISVRKYIINTKYNTRTIQIVGTWKRRINMNNGKVCKIRSRNVRVN